MSAHGAANYAFWYEIVPMEVFPIVFSINMVIMRALRFVGALICAYIWSFTSPQTSFSVIAVAWIAIALTFSALKEKRRAV